MRDVTPLTQVRNGRLNQVQSIALAGRQARAASVGNMPILKTNAQTSA